MQVNETVASSKGELDLGGRRINAKRQKDNG